MRLPYFPMFPADFEAKTSHLTLEEDGAYNRLMRLAWMTPGCSLPDDATWIARRMRIDQATYDRVVRPVLAEFFKRRNGRVFNPRLSEIRAETDEKHLRRVEAGKKGGRPLKSLKNNNSDKSNAKAMPKQPEPEPEPYREEGGGGGSAHVREAENQTFRERLLAACRADPVSGLIGPSGKIIGTQADMAEVNRWLQLPGMSEPVVLNEVARIMAKKTEPPKSLRYFTEAMCRLSGSLTAPPLSAIALPEGAISNGYATQSSRTDDRRSAERQRLGRIVSAAARGST